MSKKMRRGKHQVMFDYLPGKTIDFEKVIARISSIRGVPRTELNRDLVMEAIAEYAEGWTRPDLRPLLLSPTQDANQFILLEPRGVQAEMFPLVFWCQNRACGRVFDYSHKGPPASNRCPACHQGKLVQLRLVKIHRCGELSPLVPYCSHCKSSAHMALETHDSERISGFQWICRHCNTRSSVFGGACKSCNWQEPVPNVKAPRNMDIEVHRAGRTFYPHHVVLLNQPGQDLDAFLNVPEWASLAAATFFGFPEVQGRQLRDYRPEIAASSQASAPGLSGADLDTLMERRNRGELTPEQLVEEIQSLRQQRQQEQSTASNIAQLLVQRSGIAQEIWRRAGREMLETVLPMQSGMTQSLFSSLGEQSSVERQAAACAARTLGFADVTLVTDFPITTATFGYSRADYRPDLCRLNTFPPEKDHSGRFPIYVDLVQADAIVIRLDPDRVLRWLEANNGAPLPSLLAGTDPDLTRRAYFVQLFDQLPLRQTLRANQLQARLAFGLLHTLSHLCIRQAALLCGLDRTSLAEYILPRTLTFAIYCSHRFGATIGALAALFEQSLAAWFNQVIETRLCVYDPVCGDQGGACHACVHLAETACRFFNLNLGRPFLFGGRDTELDQVISGYLDVG